MLTMGLNVTGLDKVRKHMDALSGAQMRTAYAQALNDTAFQVRRDMQAAMRNNFDRPTPFIVKSPRVFMASADKLQATIAPTYRSQLGTTGGKQGVDPQQVLQAQELGGRRRDKKSEVVLRRAGILQRGYQTAIPATPYPGSADAYGNLRAGFLVQLLSYLQTFGEQGYRANMTARKRAALRTGTARQSGRRYFVSYGRLRGGVGAHLAPGIWAASGPGGADVRPVLMFVRMPTYTPRLRLQALADSATTTDYLSRRVRYRIRQAAGV